MNDYHLAQLNIAQAKAPLHDPSMAGFTSQLDHVFSRAERAQGFVWRLTAEDARAVALRAGSDPRLFVTLSVWESLQALRAYVYRGEHANALRQREQWFKPWPGTNLVLWWVPQGAWPSVEQGMARLKFLERHGPCPKAFTFHTWFPPPG
jgi:heme-degrading monooxygenase HmoA